jgi:hypothetical protein
MSPRIHPFRQTLGHQSVVVFRVVTSAVTSHELFGGTLVEGDTGTRLGPPGSAL